MQYNDCKLRAYKLNISKPVHSRNEIQQTILAYLINSKDFKDKTKT